MNKTMKNIFRMSVMAGVSALLFTGCEDLQSVQPNVTAGGGALTANFLFVNASPDAPDLNFYVNGSQVGTTLTKGASQSTYTNVPITTNAVGANTSIRAKAATGSIGGVLGSNDLIFRAGSTNTSNLSAANNAYYTLIALDTVNRPKPLRTLNSTNFADLTYYSSVSSFVSDTTIQLSGNNSTVIANLIKKHNSNALPSTFFSIGIVPLGSSDVGGPRFLLLTDALPTVTAGKFAARFITASPDAVSPTCKINALTVGGLTSYPMATASFNPTVGSRSTTAGFTNNLTTSGTYDVVVTVGATTITLSQQVFADGGAYTVVLTGSSAKGTLGATLMRNK